MKYAKYECVLKKCAVHEAANNYSFDKPKDVVDFLREYTDLGGYPDEHVYAVFLDVRHHIIGYTDVSTGCRSFAFVDPASIFRNAILLNASAVIMAHNHPSGDPAPSTEDIGLTKVVADAGELLRIPLIDHIILGDETHTSFSDENLMPITEKP